MPEQAQLDHLVERLRQRDPAAEQQFWEQFGPKLQRLAAKHIGRALQSRVEPEDVVQSVCRTFFRRLYDGEVKSRESHELVALLCIVTLNKTYKKLRALQTQKRDPSREVRLDADTETPFDLVGREPLPDEAAQFDEELTNLMASLGEQERQVIEMMLAGRSNEEIAAALRCTERWIRHILERIRDRLE